MVLEISNGIRIMSMKENLKKVSFMGRAPLNSKEKSMQVFGPTAHK